MRNVLLSGVGGQGTVLAAKVLAQAAQDKGWQVRTAETIGMAQRGGNVVSHVRMGDAGEEVFAPLLAEGTADLVIAFEPAEAARVLAPGGRLLIADLAPHKRGELLARQAHRWPGFDDAQIAGWLGAAGVCGTCPAPPRPLA